MQQFQGGDPPFFKKFHACLGPQVIRLSHEDVFEILLAPLFFAGTLDLLSFRSRTPELLDETVLLFELPDVVPVLSPARQLEVP